MQNIVLLSLAEAMDYAGAIVRNMILARMLTRADFGVAAMFSIVLTVFEYAGKMGLGQCVIQNERGDQPEFLGAAQSLQLGFSLASAAVLFVAGPAIATLLGVPDYEEAFRALALIPLIRGWQNLDILRVQREMRFAPAAISSVASQAAIVLAAWPCAKLVGDARAVVILLVLRSVVAVALSHVLASRRISFAFARMDLGALWGFGWPLLINGFLLFLVFQGDQVIVGGWYGVVELGGYAAAAALAMAPVFFFGKVFNAAMLPRFSQISSSGSVFEQFYTNTLHFVTAIAVFNSVFLILASDWLMHLVYGEKYASFGVILAWVTVSYSFRMLRFVPTIAALARSDSKNQLYSNSLRALSLVLAVAVASRGMATWCVAATAVAGEALAGLVCFLRLRSVTGIRLRTMLTPVFSLLAAVVLAGASSFGVSTLAESLWLQAVAAIGLAVICSLLTASLFGSSRLFLADCSRAVLSRLNKRLS